MKNNKKLITLVGLPCQGKSYLAKLLTIEFIEHGYKCRDFNSGKYRRSNPETKSLHKLMDFGDKKFRKILDKIAKSCLDDIFLWFKEVGEIAIFDATNVTRARREYILKKTKQHHVDNIFIELFTDNVSLMEHMITRKLSKNLDYKGVVTIEAREDFEKRIESYKKIYEKPKKQVPFILVSNLGESIEKNFEIHDNLEKILYTYLTTYYPLHRENII